MRKSGAWYTYDGDQLGQGKDNSRNFLLRNPQIALDIEKKIMIKLGMAPDPNAPAVTEGDPAKAVDTAKTAAVEPIQKKLASRKAV